MAAVRYPTYSVSDYRNVNDVFGQDWSRNMKLRDDTIALAMAATVSRLDGLPMTDTDMVVDVFQLVLGTDPPGRKTAFRVAQMGHSGVTYKVTLQVMTTNNAVLTHSVLLPVGAL